MVIVLDWLIDKCQEWRMKRGVNPFYLIPATEVGYLNLCGGKCDPIIVRSP